MAFRFSLRRVLDFRRLRAQVARATLERLQAERQAAETRERELMDFRRAEELAVREPGAHLAIARLDALDRMQDYVAAARRRFAQEAAELDRRTALQRTLVVEADREVGLLEKLEERQLAEWQRSMDRELEDLAADSYRSRQHRLARADAK